MFWEGFSRNGKIEIPKDLTVFEFESTQSFSGRWL